MEGGEVLIHECLPSVSELPLAFVPGIHLEYDDDKRTSTRCLH